MIESNKPWITHEEVAKTLGSLNLPDGWTHESNQAKLDKYFKKYSKCRKNIYQRHLSSLTRAERKLLNKGDHPSQSPQREETAKAVAQELKTKLIHQGVTFVKDVQLGLYHGDRLILSIAITNTINDHAANAALPFYYRGFETRWRREAP